MLHWPAGSSGKGALLTGDTIQVVPDRRWVSFMYSYPNFVPLNANAVRKIVAAVEPLAFDRIYGAFPGLTVQADGKQSVVRSAERYSPRSPKRERVQEREPRLFCRVLFRTR